MMVKKTIALAQIIPQYRETDGLGRRRLLTPDEILRFPNDELLIVIRGVNVLRARKFDYLGHPYAKKIIPASIFDYNPQNTATPTPRTEHEQRSESPVDVKNQGSPQTENKKPAAKLFAAAKPPDEF